MFAFALWDPAARELLLARDRIGEKPFYWTDAGGSFVFGSEIKAMLAHPAVSPRSTRPRSSLPRQSRDRRARDAVRGINKLAPGELGACGRDGVRIRRYWELFEPRRFASSAMADAAREVRERAGSLGARSSDQRRAGRRPAQRRP